MAAISIEGLTKRFGNVLAVDDLSFTVEPGTITGFIGPNGSGKTTTLRTLLGLVRANAGTALIDGQRYEELKTPAFRVGAAFETSGFHPGRTARNHLRILAHPSGISRKRVEEVLELVDLTGAAARRVGGFSLGMRQRLMLAGALLGDPNLLILDEPTNGLDPAGVQWLRDCLRHRVDAGGTVLVSSHLLAELALSVDAVVIINRGRLVSQGTVRELTGAGASRVRVQSPQARELHAVLAARGIAADLESPKELVVPGATTQQVGEAVAAAGLVVHEIKVERQNLEDAFLRLIRAQENDL